jgi:hypothetical protein
MLTASLAVLVVTGLALGRGADAATRATAHFDLRCGRRLPLARLPGHAAFGETNPLGHWYFFAYDPANATGAYILPSAGSPVLSCHTTVSFVRDSSPAVKVAASKVYVVGVDSGFTAFGDRPITNPDLLVNGAKVRYTCPNGC